MRFYIHVAVIAFASVQLFVTLASADTQSISFNRDIRPLLSDNCFHCHGPDSSHRKADLRLDQREDAVDYGAIVPGSPSDSSLVDRVFTDDPDLVMPPPDSHKKLTNEQKELLKNWIDEGGESRRECGRSS